MPDVSRAGRAAPRVGDRARLVRRPAERDVRTRRAPRRRSAGDEDGHGFTRSPPRRATAIGTSAASASSAPRRNGRENAAVTARSSSATQALLERPVLLVVRPIGERATDVGHLAVGGAGRWRGRPARRRACRAAGSSLSSTAAAPARSARSSLRSSARREDGCQEQQADDDPRVPRRDRPAAVHRLRRATVQRALGERREREPEARIRRAPAGAIVHHQAEPGSTPSAASPPAMRIAPAAARVARAADARARQRRVAIAAARHDGDDDARRRRRRCASRRRAAARAGTAPRSARRRRAAARGSRGRSAVPAGSTTRPRRAGATRQRA